MISRVMMVCAFSIGFVSGGAARAETVLTAMSFNVRYGTAMDGENAWPKRRDILVNAIKQYAPQVLGLQECLSFQAEYIVEQLPEYRWFGVGRDADGTGEMTAVLYRHKEAMPMETGHFWLSEQPDTPGSVSWDSSLTRMATWARFRHIQSDKRYFVFNTHFDHRGREARVESARMIAARVAALPAELPVLVLGDFNAKAGDSEPYSALTADRLQDSWLQAESKAGPANTWSGFEAPKEEVDNRIDWILYSGPLRALHAEIVTFNENGRYPSDHFPVFAKFALE